MSRNKARRFCASGQFEEAVSHLKALLRQQPLDDELWLDLARCYLESDRLDKAKHCFHKSVRLNAKRVDAWYGYAITLEALGELAASLEAFQTVLQLKPDCEAARQRIGGLYLRTGQYAQAIELFRQLILLRRCVTHLLGYGLAMDYAGKTQAAVKAYEKVLAFKPNTRHQAFLQERIAILRQSLPISNRSARRVLSRVK